MDEETRYSGGILSDAANCAVRVVERSRGRALSTFADFSVDQAESGVGAIANIKRTSENSWSLVRIEEFGRR